MSNRNGEFTLIRGHLYRIHSRNLPYGVYDGNGGFIGIREKFGELYLDTEDGHDRGGTVTVQEDLGPIPAGIRIAEQEPGLYAYLAAAEQRYDRGTGYGGRPGDEDETPWVARENAP